jgi:hypothetical protein
VPDNGNFRDGPILDGPENLRQDRATLIGQFVGLETKKQNEVLRRRWEG